MFHKFVLIAGIFAAALICEASCQFIFPTYRPPPQPRQPVIMRARRSNDEPLWLYKGDDFPKAPAAGDHPFLPKYIDDIKLDPNTRVARSVSTPGGMRGGGTRQSSNHDTGATHPGYNRRNARALPSLPYPTLPPFNPRLPNPDRPWETKPNRWPMYV